MVRHLLRDFQPPAVFQIRRERQRFSGSGEISQSEKDWAYSLRQLERGTDPAWPQFPRWCSGGPAEEYPQLRESRTPSFAGTPPLRLRCSSGLVRRPQKWAFCSMAALATRQRSSAGFRSARSDRQLRKPQAAGFSLERRDLC